MQGMIGGWHATFPYSVVPIVVRNIFWLQVVVWGMLEVCGIVVLCETSHDGAALAF